MKAFENVVLSPFPFFLKLTLVQEGPLVLCSLVQEGPLVTQASFSSMSIGMMSLILGNPDISA